MIDFHCHIDLYQHPRYVIEEAFKRCCDILAVTTTPLAWEGTYELLSNTTRVNVAVGLHPELVATRQREVERLCALLSETDYVGEIGLDGSRGHQASISVQREVFEQILIACEAVEGRIMSIHSREAASLVLDHLGAHHGAGIPVLHWFSGTLAELKRAVEIGCWFSVGPAMLRGAKGRRLVSSMPIDRVLTETDGPLARRGREPLMPWYVDEAEVALGKIWRLPLAAVQRQLHENLRHLRLLHTVKGRKGQSRRAAVSQDLDADVRVIKCE